jgi:hypothetical protein
VSAKSFGGLTQGQHTIYVHAKDALRKWGELTSVIFTKDTRGPVTSDARVSPSPTGTPPVLTAKIDDSRKGGSIIVAAEYFIDKKGKTGRGVPILAAFDNALETITATLDAARFERLKPGKHTIYVHGKDAAGNWGNLLPATFKKTVSARAEAVTSASLGTTRLSGSSVPATKAADAAMMAFILDWPAHRRDKAGSEVADHQPRDSTPAMR